MIIDLNEAGPEALSGTFDLAVCGTGPAGMTVAREVAARGGRVLLLEGGGLDPSAQSQAVYEGESVGTVPYPHVQSCRLRYLGGTSMHWSGRCAIFDRIDFEPRAIFGMPGWPISYDEAYRRLADAMAILDLAPDALARDPEGYDWPSDRFRVARFALSSPTRFGTKYRDELAASDRILTVLNANVTDMTLSADGRRVESAEVTRYDGAAQTVRADRFVLAMGALENARFLLNANRQEIAGLGNATDWVGRAFMEHFEIQFGRFVTRQDAFWSKMPSDMLALLPTQETMRRLDVGNGTLALKVGAPPRFYGRAAPLRKIRRDITCASPALLRAARAEGDLVCPGDGFTGSIMEHLPNRDSRVLLQEDARDQFGKPRLAVRLEIQPNDLRTVRALAEQVGMGLAETDLARFKIDGGVYEGGLSLGGHCHQMGTTRMAERARDGVVDADCRVHGTENLYVSGSSVFPTGGGVNPTLTIVALALRLGEHIGNQL